MRFFAAPHPDSARVLPSQRWAVFSVHEPGDPPHRVFARTFVSRRAARACARKLNREAQRQAQGINANFVDNQPADMRENGSHFTNRQPRN